MNQAQSGVKSEVVNVHDLYSRLLQVPIFAMSKPEDLDCLGEVELVEADAGTMLYQQGDKHPAFWILVEGELRASKTEADGAETPLATLGNGETFGEVPILVGTDEVRASCEVVKNSTLVRVSNEGFWRLMASCPTVRGKILANMARRLQAYQALTLHREKLISLGTLAAGLMHELNNPGAAAKRAASQLRENLNRLQEISLRFTQNELSSEQINCLHDLKQEVLANPKPAPISSIEQSDAEEALAEWMESVGVQNAWRLAPTLVSIGWSEQDVQCAREVFPPNILSDTLNWLEALISSMQLVGTIEESIARVTDLVMAVKKYAYDDKAKTRDVDVLDSIQSTLTILGHKFRHKELNVEKQFQAELPKITTRGTGLTQVWTNLLDNAIDAAPQAGNIAVRVWSENGMVCVGIADNGPGIQEEHMGQIFEPFFTTKPVGVGTGLGLDIAHRIVVGHYGGQISFTTEPGKTEFLVRLPVRQ
jgi:signal transduction histidine kinase